MKMNIGMEAARFQDGSLFKILNMHMERIMQMNLEDWKSNSYDALISSEIMKQTGLNVKVALSDYPDSITMPAATRNHVFTARFRNSGQNVHVDKLITEAKNIIKGTVDLKAAKVTGFFSELEFHIFLDVNRIYKEKNKFSAQENTAILMHELGHAFTFCQVFHHTTVTNLVMEGIARARSASYDPKVLETHIGHAKEVLSLPELDAAKLSQTNNKTNIDLLVITSVLNKPLDQDGVHIYNQTQCEAMADNFAAHHGAGRHLVTALSKLQGHRHIAYRSTATHLFVEACKLSLLVTSMVLAAAPGVGILGLLGSRITASLFVSAIMLDTEPLTYDRPAVRATRIRNELVELIKTKKLSKEHEEQIRKDVEFLNEQIKEISDRVQFFTEIGKIVIPSVRERYSQEKKQRELEALAANDLFLL